MDALMITVFLAGSSMILLVSLLWSGRSRRVEQRIQELSGAKEARPDAVAQLAETALPVLGKPLLPTEEKERTLLKTRLIRAGLYRGQALAAFLGVKMILIVAPVALGIFAGLSGLLPLMQGIVFGLLLSVVGIYGPGFWLDWRKVQRQAQLRQGLPDALDIIVLCLDGGLSLQGAIQRVCTELRTVYPLLAGEMSIVQREIHLGRSTGEALREFADRSDLEEIRSLASVILQSERLGASVAKSLRVHAEALRLKRLHRAEELAYTAGTKMLIPTILFIFPAMLYVVAGPALFHIIELFASIQR